MRLRLYSGYGYVVPVFLVIAAITGLVLKSVLSVSFVWAASVVLVLYASATGLLGLVVNGQKNDIDFYDYTTHKTVRVRRDSQLLGINLEYWAFLAPVVFLLTWGIRTHNHSPPSAVFEAASPLGAVRRDDHPEVASTASTAMLPAETPTRPAVEAIAPAAASAPPSAMATNLQSAAPPAGFPPPVRVDPSPQPEKATVAAGPAVRRLAWRALARTAESVVLTSEATGAKGIVIQASARFAKGQPAAFVFKGFDKGQPLAFARSAGGAMAIRTWVDGGAVRLSTSDPARPQEATVTFAAPPNAQDQVGSTATRDEANGAAPTEPVGPTLDLGTARSILVELPLPNGTAVTLDLNPQDPLFHRSVAMLEAVVKPVEPPPAALVPAQPSEAPVVDRGPPPRPDWCRVRPTKAEARICGDAGLLWKEAEVTALYSKAVAASANRAMLRSAVQQWIDKRESCGGLTSTALQDSCIHASFDEWAATLQKFTR